MNEKLRKHFEQRVEKLIDEGKRVSEHYEHGRKLNTQRLASWVSGCQSLLNDLGPAAQSWQVYAPASLHSTHYGVGGVYSLLGALESLLAALRDNLLGRVEDLVLADAFDSLLEQAEELFDKGYLVPAGTLGRAVLEEHLRSHCLKHGCMPAKPRPTLNDLNQSLYGARQLDKLQMKQVDALAAAGNHCAHNEQPQLPAGEVKSLLDGVRAFITNHPLT